MTTKPRQPKTPRQRAEETLAVAQRRFDRLTDAHSALVDQLEDLDEQLLDAGARLDYARQDPALQDSNATQPDPTGDNPA